jgi:hypothetical protein
MDDMADLRVFFMWVLLNHPAPTTELRQVVSDPTVPESMMRALITEVEPVVGIYDDGPNDTHICVQSITLYPFNWWTLRTTAGAAFTIQSLKGPTYLPIANLHSPWIADDDGAQREKRPGLARD